MTRNKFEAQDVIKILEFDGYKKTNRYLDIGWVLIGTFSVQYSENGFAPKYSLGWLKQNGEVKFPEKTELEIQMENSSGLDIPF
jgi:hypothetical protein